MRRLTATFVAFLWVSFETSAYPLYGSEESGIRRLEAARLAHEGMIPGRKRVPGELLRVEHVDLRLLDRRDMELPKPDAAFTEEVASLLGDDAEHYGVAVLDLSNPDAPRYAEFKGDVVRNPGSVGKVAAAIGLFQALADTYPDDVGKRRAVLAKTVVTADDFIVQDTHKIRWWDPATKHLARRPLQIGDRGTLLEYLDWMLSASANAAASMVMQQAMLLEQFGTEYPLSPEASRQFFEETPKSALAELAARTFQEPLVRSGIDTGRLRQGSFFTAQAKEKVPGVTSYVTARELMKLMLRLEQGRIVDEFSSREIKRLLYMTERRVRYAASPELHKAAVYFKSGSFYACQPEPDYRCRKYRGNKKNLMNSIAIVEYPARQPRIFYMVSLISNVLRKNSAVEHRTFATNIHRMMRRAHPKPEDDASARLRKERERQLASDRNHPFRPITPHLKRATAESRG